MIYDILYKIAIAAKSLRIRFDKAGGFIRVYDGTTYLVSFGPNKYVAIYNRIRYLIIQKSSIMQVFSHYYAKIKIDSDDNLPLEKTLILDNMIILIKSFLIRIIITTTVINSFKNIRIN